MPKSIPHRLWLLVPALAFVATSASAEPPLRLTGATEPFAETQTEAPLPERIIEKRDGRYHYRLAIRPGALQPDRVAELIVEVSRVLDIPDPITGDRAPVNGARLIAAVRPPATSGRGAAPAARRYSTLPQSNPGSYGFHFTPAVDGVFQVAFTGEDPTGEKGDFTRRLSTTFTVGVGSAAAQTEQSQGAAGPRRSARRPVGAGTAAKATEEKLRRLMDEIGRRHLGLEALLARPPAKGPNAAAAAEARAIAALLGETKTLIPARYIEGTEEYETLANQAAERFLALAVSAEGRKATVDALESAEMQSCIQCHAKYRYGITTDLAQWPQFEQKPWKQ